MYVSAVRMPGQGQFWSKMICILSSWSFPRYLTYDTTSDTLYFASDYDNDYIFICKIRATDGFILYCVKIDGDGEDYPYFLKVIGNYLLVAGTSSSSAFKSDPLHSWGNYVIMLKKDLRSDSCSSLNLEHDISLNWVDEPLPQKEIWLVSIEVKTTSYF